MCMHAHARMHALATAVPPHGAAPEHPAPRRRVRANVRAHALAHACRPLIVAQHAARQCAACAAVDAAGGPPPTQRRQKPDGWQMAREHQQQGLVHEGMVKGVNKGGILIDCWGVRGAPPTRALPPGCAAAPLLARASSKLSSRISAARAPPRVPCICFRSCVPGATLWIEKPARVHVPAPIGACMPRHVMPTVIGRAFPHACTTCPRRAAAGFIPNSMLVSTSARPEEGMRVKAIFVEVNELENRMILSQKQVYQAQLLAALRPGQEVEARPAPRLSMQALLRCVACLLCRAREQPLLRCTGEWL